MSDRKRLSSTTSREAQPLPKIGLWRDKLDRLLVSNESNAARERLTLIRLFEELRGLGYDGGYDAVRRYGNNWRDERGASTAAAYVPLSFAPGEAYQFVRDVKARGAVLKATEQPIDTGTAAGKCFLDMLGVFAEFETNLRRERQLEGIAKAKAAGVYRGRKPSIDPAEVKKLKAGVLGAAAIAKRLKIGRASVYRVL